MLWSLSISAGDWQTSEKLTRLCTIPEPAILSGTWDRSAYAMEAIILRPLKWFGLLEHRSKKNPDSRFAAQHYYRKAPMFDRLLAFNVKMDTVEGPPSLMKERVAIGGGRAPLSPWQHCCQRPGRFS